MAYSFTVNVITDSMRVFGHSVGLDHWGSKSGSRYLPPSFGLFKFMHPSESYFFMVRVQRDLCGC